MDQYTIRDTSFHWLYRAMGFKAEDDPGSTINLELGYGGARLLDCRWLGPLAYEEIVNVLFRLQEGGGKLNIVGSSAGNVIAASLAMILPIRHACCGFDTEDRKRRYKTDVNKFERSTNLRIPTGEDLCACDTIRRIYDFLFEITALSEHPSWHDYKLANVEKDVVPGTRREPKMDIFLKTIRSTPVKQLKYDMISDIFEGTRTVESTLYFSDEVASAFTLMYTNEPLRYATVMYRIVDDLQGKMILAYMLSRYLLTQCILSVMPPDGDAQQLQETCTIHLGSKNLNTNEFVFTDITKLRPLTRFLDNSPTVAADERYEKDAEAMNEILTKLVSGVDMRDMAFPVISDFIWKRKSKMLNVRGDEASRAVAAAWQWDGNVPSYDRYDSRLLKRVVLSQNNVDIMTGSKGHLPNYAEAVGGGSNYIFELSPLGKHLFSVDEVSGLFEACTPGLNIFQLKSAHNREGNKIATLVHGTPFVARV
jgi:hypothetical protein